MKEIGIKLTDNEATYLLQLISWVSDNLVDQDKQDKKLLKLLFTKVDKGIGEEIERRLSAGI